MRRLPFTPPNQLVGVTYRTFQGFLFLLPGARWNDVFLGVLGRAQRLYGMEIHFGSTLLDRYSLLLSPSSFRLCWPESNPRRAFRQSSNGNGHCP